MSAAYDYAPLESKATELIQRFGREVTFARKAKTPEKPYMESQGDQSASVVAAQSVTAKVVQGKSDEVVVTLQRLSKKTIVLYLVEAVTFAEGLSTDWTMTDDGVILEVVNVRKVKPGDTLLLYKVAVEV